MRGLVLLWLCKTTLHRLHLVRVGHGILIIGMHLEPSLSCPNQYSLHGEGHPRMEAMEVTTGVVEVFHHLLQGVHLLVLHHQETCHHGELRPLQALEAILKDFPWAVHHHLPLQVEKLILRPTAVEILLVDGVCLHGEGLHLHQVDHLHLALFHLLQEEEVLLLRCHTGIKVVEIGMAMDSQVSSQTFLEPHHHLPHQVNKSNLCLLGW